MKVDVLQHVPFETPREFAPALHEAGGELRTWLVPRDGLPTGDEDVLIVMGGPMSVNDPEAWIAAEIDYIGAAVARGVPVLGICLGSQLIARAIGGSVYPGERPEIGLGEIRLTDAGRIDHSVLTSPAHSSLCQCPAAVT